jgi:hypothetical protein
MAVNAGMDGLQRSTDRGSAIVAACRSKPLPSLRSTKLGKVFTYGIVAMRGTRFAHLGMVVDGGGGWRRRGSSVGFGRRHRQALVLLR